MKQFNEKGTDHRHLTLNRQLTPELARAEHFANILHRRIAFAKRFQLDKVQFEFAEAEELSQLLFDSLRTAKELLK